MAMTNAEKQAAYRVRKIKEGDGERLQAVVSFHTKLALERLAKFHGLTQTAMLEKIILEAQSQATRVMDSDQHSAYLDGKVTV